MCHSCDSLRAFLEGKNGEVFLTGCPSAAFAWFLASALHGRREDRSDPPIVILTPNLKTAEQLASDLEIFSGLPSTLYPPTDILPYLGLEPHPDRTEARLAGLEQLIRGDQNLISIAPLEAAAWKTLPPQTFGQRTLRVTAGDTLDRDTIIQHITSIGYERIDVVTTPMTFAVRGGLLDIFPVASPTPYRIEFFGDLLESIRSFNTESQISTGTTPSLRIPPASERNADETARATFFDYLSPGVRLIQIEPDEGLSVVTRLFQEVERLYLSLPSPSRRGNKGGDRRFEGVPDPSYFLLPPSSLKQTLELRGPLSVTAFERPEASSISAGTTVPLQPIRHPPPKEFWTALGEKGSSGETIVIAAGTEIQKNRITHLLGGAAPHLKVLPHDLSGGFRLEAHHLTVLNESDLFGSRRKKPPSPKPHTVTSTDDLKIGDFVVHTDHGVGIFRGMTHMTIGRTQTDFLTLEYLGGDKLYLPVDRMNLVSRYVAADASLPRLSRLGSPAWNRAKARATLAARRLAKDLLRLYAARSTARGFAFSPDTDDVTSFEATFPYDETPDQLRAVGEVKQDMEGEKPMDRLLVGDVGYGKTEVALRAAFKAVMDGKQAALLVPTTILALQHFETFSERLAEYPLRTEMLSRLRPTREQKELLADLAGGKVDIVIGTHRLLQPDVVFRDLGLLVLDEEHRFGVKDKERIRRLKADVDTLALSATPIPRTLYMSLAGIRDLSVIMTPPEERLAVRTFVAPTSDLLIKEAILQEVLRGGQVYFVHNRVQGLAKLTEGLRQKLPKVRFAIAHGQMEARDLERVMLTFYHRNCDVLVTTTIIESGLDVPTANTILIDQADTFGLAQLYQLRGRVGRSNIQAYAYLLVDHPEAMTPPARARLTVLQKFAQLGSGWAIASHDLEIRGAGNLLGREQSGHMGAIGFDLYTQMLQKAVAELKGEETLPPIEPHIQLPIAAFLPESYIPDAALRLSLYRRLARLEKTSEIDSLKTEFSDRFGPLPKEADALFQIVDLKALAKRLRIQKILGSGDTIALTFDPTTPLNPDVLIDRAKRDGKRYGIAPQAKFWTHLKAEEKGRILETTSGLLAEFASTLPSRSLSE